jgi:hypothetical protein
MSKAVVLVGQAALNSTTHVLLTNKSAAFQIRASLAFLRLPRLERGGLVIASTVACMRSRLFQSSFHFAARLAAPQNNPAIAGL